MNSSEVTRDGLTGVRPGREALPGAPRPAGGRARGDGGDGGGGFGRRSGRHRRDEPASYYGLPVINAPVWEAREIAGYFFLGGLAGASSLVALGAQLTGRPVLARGAKAGAAGAIGLSLVALVKDLGRPGRFLHMLRVFKPTSPMSVGTWIVSGYAPAAFAAAASDLTGILPAAGLLATGGAAVLAPAVASYTGVLIADTAVPAWHEARAEMPFLFVASAASAGAGLGLVVAADDEAGPVRRLAALGAAGELVAEYLLERRLEPVVRRPYTSGKAGALLKASKVLAAAGGAAALFGGRSKAVRIGAGAALLAASACTRFGVFYAGMDSAKDPAATIEPQKARLAREHRVPG
ncbi:MAG TPA: NrfD/PsrC family molybdoenzyme membrane anchor subunit [Streptosporangiaceae bacterium]